MGTSNIRRSLGLLAVALIAGCPWKQRIPHSGSEPPSGKAPACHAGISSGAYADCTCGNLPRDPGPGDICSPPKTLYERVCLIDASCNAHRFDPAGEPLEPITDRDDIAVRWEFAEPLPAGAKPALNRPPIEDHSRTQTPFSLYGTKAPSEDDFAPNPGPDTWIDAEVLVSGDRKAVTIVPKQRCIEGRWWLRSEVMLDLIYGDDVCGESDGIRMGYAASFAIE